MKRWLALATVLVLPLSASAKPLLLAHMMPWYQAKPFSASWGWHWTMGKFEPDKGNAASRFHPVIGYYDSSDPDVIEYQLLTMKAAGIGGVLVDWYGDQDVYDYLPNHLATLKILKGCEKFGLKFGLVYEDQTLPNLIKFGKVRPDGTAEALSQLLQRLETSMFASPAYLRENGHPVFLVFGPQYYQKDELVSAIKTLKNPPAYYSLMDKKPGAVGGYAWPAPQKGLSSSWDEIETFTMRAKSWPHSIPVVYPRFLDIYAQAGVQAGYPEIPDDEGKTLQRTLNIALAQGTPFVQICTWNDWGEGTQIEPSTEFGTRALEQVQAVAGGNPQDISLPLRLYRLRKAKDSPKTLNDIALDLSRGRYDSARKSLENLKPESRAHT